MLSTALPRIPLSDDLAGPCGKFEWCCYLEIHSCCVWCNSLKLIVAALVLGKHFRILSANCWITFETGCYVAFSLSVILYERTFLLTEIQYRKFFCINIVHYTLYFLQWSRDSFVTLCLDCSKMADMLTCLELLNVVSTYISTDHPAEKSWSVLGTKPHQNPVMVLATGQSWTFSVVYG